jgi:hypothetical protein
MSKNFAQAPKPRPSPEAIARFERGGSGQDTKTHIPTNTGTGEPTEVGLPVREPQTHNSSNEGKREPTEVGQTPRQDNTQTHIPSNAGTGEPTEVVESEAAEASKEPTRRLSVDLPASLHRRFKTACSKTDRKMLAEVTAFIRSRTIELENEGRGRE